MKGRGTRAGWFPDPSARRPWATEEETAGDGGDAGPSVRAGAGGVGGGATALRPLSVRGIRMRPAHPGAADSAFVTFAPCSGLSLFYADTRLILRKLETWPLTRLFATET